MGIQIYEGIIVCFFLFFFYRIGASDLENELGRGEVAFRRGIDSLRACQ